MEQLLLHAAAAQLAAAVFAKVTPAFTDPNAPGYTLNADGTITINPNTKAVDLEIWELHRIFYNGLSQTLTNPSGSWPVPASQPTQQAGTALGSGLIASLAPLLTGTGPLAPFIDMGIKAITGLVNKTAVPTAPNSLPSPGAAGS